MITHRGVRATMLFAVSAGGLVASLGSGACRAMGDSGRSTAVVCFVFDAAAASHFGAYGYSRNTTPNFDRLAREALLFRNHFATAPYTLSSFASIFTSAYPPSHGLIRRGDRLSPNQPLLAEFLKERGIRTGAFVSNPWLDAGFGFSRGFDEYQNYQPGQPAPRQDGSIDRAGLLRDVSRFLSESRGRRFFLLVHVLLPHNPYRPPSRFRKMFVDPGYRGSFDASTRELLAVDSGARKVTSADRNQLIDLYDGNLRYADWMLGEIVQTLRQAGRWDHTAMIVTADHGEAFGQHGRYLHNSTVYDEMIHVPLVVRLGKPPSGSPDTVSVGDHVDLLPTIAEIFGIDRPSAAGQGQSLLAPDRAIRKPFVLSFSTELDLEGFRSAREKYIRGRDGHTEYYALVSDPGERENLVQSEPGLDEALARRLLAYEQSLARPRIPETTPVPGSGGYPDVESLRALGYLGGSDRRTPEPAHPPPEARPTRSPM